MNTTNDRTRRGLMESVPRLAAAALAGGLMMSAAASAETLLFTEDFQSYGALDPATGDLGFDAVWAYSGPGGGNSSRTFAAGGNGSGMESIGWITLVDGSAITATVPLTGLAGTDADNGSGNILADATFRLKFVVAAETSDAVRDVIGSFGVAPSSGMVTFVSGTNGDGSQTLTAFTDTYTANGGSVGKTMERTFTIEFVTSGMTTVDTLDLSVGFVSSASAAFYYVDDIELLVNPEQVDVPGVSAAPATVLSSLSATIGGEVTDDGNETPNVKLYWGTTNGMDDPMAWDEEIDLGLQGGIFSQTLAGLSPETEYFFRAFAENSAGGMWTSPVETFTTNALQGVTATLDSADFTWNYEMDENPSGQDLDGAGAATDWFAGTAGGLTIPQNYTGGVAFSNQSPGSTPEVESVMVSRPGDDAVLDWVLSEAGGVNIYGTEDLEQDFLLLGNVESGTTTFTDFGVAQLYPDRYFYRIDPVPAVATPQVLFRTDFGGSIQREQLIGTGFTMEIAVKVIGPKDPASTGIFGVAIDPGTGQSSFRLNIDATEVSQNGGVDDVVVTGDNTDALHVFRVAYSLNDDRYWVWRDGLLVYGGDLMTGVAGTNGDFNPLGAFFIGDFSGIGLTGEWEVDYIRLIADVVAPL